LAVRPGEGSDFAEIVDGAWDFAQINRRYARHLEVLNRCPTGELADAGAARALRRWAADDEQG
jgi:hypothetical protein